jgi:hypothetical protein
LLSFYAELQVVKETTCMAKKAEHGEPPRLSRAVLRLVRCGMRVWGVLSAAVILAGGLSSCDPPAQVGAGAECNSLSECKAGLTCIEGVCDGDLTSIAGQVPVYADAGAAAATGGAATVDAGAGP